MLALEFTEEEEEEGRCGKERAVLGWVSPPSSADSWCSSPVFLPPFGVTFCVLCERNKSCIFPPPLFLLPLPLKPHVTQRPPTLFPVVGRTGWRPVCAPLEERTVEAPLEEE